MGTGKFAPGRRAFVCAIAIGVASSWTGVAAADDYPGKPITLIVPFTAGGGTDQVARAFAEALKKELGQPVTVQNLPGAGSATGTTRLHESAADGYTLGMTGGFLVSTALRGQFKPSPMDFTHLARLSQETFVLATQASAPYAKLSDYLAASRAKPGSISIATAGAGALTDLAAEALNQETKASLNVVNFPGGARELTAVLGGHASAGVFSQVEVLPQVGAAGGLRVLASFGETRSEKLPDTPTLKELGVSGVPAGPWQGIAAPKGIPAAVKAKLDGAIARAARDPQWLAFLSKSGLASSYLAGAAYDAFLHGEEKQLGGLMKSMGLMK
jgi:tripartite-type tricarboxylate transporter receptor subunit TctC